MSERKDEKWLDGELRRAIEQADVRFDGDAWKRRHAKAYEMLATRRGQQGAVTHRRQKIRFARAARLAIAAAIVGAVALALIVTRPQANERPGSSSPPHRDKASADVTFLSLRTAYRQGGEEALNRQLDTAQETLGPWPDRSSLRDLWDDIRS